MTRYSIAVLVADVVERADVGMRERRDRLRLALEPLPHVLVRREVRRQDLDRDRALEPRVLRPVDLSHPSRADRGEDLVRPEPATGGERSCKQNVPDVPEEADPAQFRQLSVATSLLEVPELKDAQTGDRREVAVVCQQRGAAAGESRRNLKGVRGSESCVDCAQLRHGEELGSIDVDQAEAAASCEQLLVSFGERDVARPVRDDQGTPATSDST